MTRSTDTEAALRLLASTCTLGGPQHCRDYADILEMRSLVECERVADLDAQLGDDEMTGTRWSALIMERLAVVLRCVAADVEALG